MNWMAGNKVPWWIALSSHKKKVPILNPTQTERISFCSFHLLLFSPVSLKNPKSKHTPIRGCPVCISRLSLMSTGKGSSTLPAKPVGANGVRSWMNGWVDRMVSVGVSAAGQNVYRRWGKQNVLFLSKSHFFNNSWSWMYSVWSKTTLRNLITSAWKQITQVEKNIYCLSFIWNYWFHCWCLFWLWL